MWIAPKINWDSESRFDKDDYNRIKNNLLHLQDLANELYLGVGVVSLDEDLVYSSYIYSTHINSIESLLHSLNSKTLHLQIGDMKTYYANQPFINFVELNRIESASLEIFKMLSNQAQGRKMLKFTLNGGMFNG